MDTKTVQKIAKLSKLKLTEEEIQKYSTQLANIFELFESLKEVDTAGVEFLSFVEVNNLREDVAEKSLSQQEALSNANKVINSGFGVPSVLGKAT